MSIEITTTHTITCENAPVEEVLKELRAKNLDFTTGSYRVCLTKNIENIVRQRDEARTEIESLTRERDELIEQHVTIGQERDDAAEANVSLAEANERLTRERDEVQKRLEAADKDILAGGSRPALPKGIRLAEHDEYGRVVVSPGMDINGYYRIFAFDDDTLYKADCWYVKTSKLTFLEEEPAPAPLPAPEDCKAGEAYLAEVSGQEVVATRCYPTFGRYPWFVSDDNEDYSCWRKDKEITLLARLVPDRDYKEQA